MNAQVVSRLQALKRFPGHFYFMSKDAYYFSHDTNAFFDPKIRLIVSEFGVFAYGVFWIILEMLAAQKEYKILRKDFEKALCPLLQGKKIIYSGVGGVTGFIDEEDNQITEQLVGCHCISLAYATELFCMMLNIGLFKTDDIFFYSESLLERMKKKEELSEKYRNNALKRWEKHNNAMALQSVKPSTARKERKGKYIYRTTVFRGGQ